MPTFGSRNPVIYVVPFIVVASLIVIVTLLRHGRRIYTWSRFNQYQGTVQPRYDLPVHRSQQRPFTEPYYPVMPYGSTAPAQPPPVVTMTHHRASDIAPVTVPVSNAPTITPYIPDSASISGRHEVIREADEERYLPPPSYEYASSQRRA